jgi:hypothetical protein
MTPIQQALQQLQGQSQVKVIQHYVQTGDAKALGQLKSGKQTGYSWEGTVLAQALAEPVRWADEDRRLVQALAAAGLFEGLADRLNDSLQQEKPTEDIFGMVSSVLQAGKSSGKDIVALAGRIRYFARDDKPNSAGRFLLGLGDEELKHAAGLTHGDYYNLNLVGFLLDQAMDRIPAILPVVLHERRHCGNAESVAAMVLEKGGKRFEMEVHDFFQAMKDPFHRFHLGQALVEYDPKYREEGLTAARASLAGPTNTNNHGPIAEWMLKEFGKTVLGDVVAYLGDPERGHYYWRQQILNAAVEHLGKDALPAVLTTLESRSDSKLQLDAVTHLIAFNDASQDTLIQTELEKCLEAGPDEKPSYRTTDSYTQVVRAVGLIGRWNPKRFAGRLWSLLNHKSKAVRDAVARSLGQAGEESVPPAARLLQEGKAAARLAAVMVLTTANTPKALKVLEDRLDEESDDEVRDAILLGLESAWAASGRKVTKKDIEARITRAADKIKTLPASWIKEAKLPALKFQKGGPLGKEAVRYLLYRQSRAKEMRPDVEAKALFALIDQSTSGNFALEILKGYLGSKVDSAERWAMTLAGLLGDDRLVAVLNQQIRQWADGSRGKMAEYAVQALALLGSDAALLTVDALAIRYRNKNKNVGRAAVEAFAAAAEALGITPEELGDRVVPWLGFEPGKPRLINCGGKKVEARIGLDLKLKFIDLEKNKPVALPKTAPKEVQAEFKELAATLREVVKAQLLRLENLMVRQQRWPMDRWQKLFLVHPVLLPLASRLVWGVYDDKDKLRASFRPLEDQTLTQASDEPYPLPKSGTIGIVHPLELTGKERTTWQTSLADYEITPPFPQLERAVVHLTPDRAEQKVLKDFEGMGVNAMTFKGRAERLGWSRGSVCDAGSITGYVKSFPAAGVDVFLGLEGMFIGIDMYSDIKLQDAMFVRSGSVKTGSYVYDEPSNDQDNRLLRFADVPPIVYSEVMGDLQKIAGKKEASGDDE